MDGGMAWAGEAGGLLEGVQAMSLPGVEPGDTGTAPEARWIDVDRLLINRAYQRDLTPKSVKAIAGMVSGWDWELAGALTVKPVDGGFFEVIDGQHRAIAAKTRGIPQLLAVVGKAADVQVRATMFVRLNTLRTGVSASQRHKAAVAAGDETAKRIEACAKRAGAEVLGTPPSGSLFSVGQTVAVSALARALKVAGDAGLTRVLRICVQADLRPIKADHILGLSTLFSDPAWKDEPIDEAKLIEIVRRWHLLRDDVDMARIDSGAPLGTALATEMYRRCGRKSAA